MTQLTRADQLVGQKAPRFERESTQGVIAAWDLSGNRPRILLFCPSLGDGGCSGYLRQLSEHAADLENLDALVVVITAEQAAGDIDRPVIVNAADLFAEFGLTGAQGRPRAGVMLLDRYGFIDSIFGGDSLSDLAPADVLVRRLLSAEATCPECGVPEAQWGSVTSMA